MNINPRSQDYIDIVDIKNDILILTGGRFRLVVETTAVNFDLLSEDEQNATIFAYANLVNSLDYPLQILVRTRQVDITSYVQYLKGHLRNQPTAALREQLSEYIEFSQQLVVDNTVLQKAFYIIIPYFQATAGQSKSKSLMDVLPFMGKKTTAEKTDLSPETLEKIKRELVQRFEELRWQFKRLGIQIRYLTTEELIRLFYEIYNPEAAKNQGLREDVFGYTTFAVKSSLRKEDYEESAQQS